MRFLYSCLLYLLLPLIMLRLCIKGRKNPAYRERIQERFAVHLNRAPVDVWIHAVSFGEVVATNMLVEHLLFHHKRVLLTTMTPTGSEQVKRLFGTRVLHQYIPYDLPQAVRRFFKNYQPRVGIIMETELWPNLMFEAKANDVMLFIANARISDAAFPTYRRVRWFFKPLWQYVQNIFTQSQLDADRFCQLGAPRYKVRVLGNIKSDLKISHDVSEPLRSFKMLWGEARPVMIAASTHEGEEEQILSILKALQQVLPDMLLLIAPRHCERFDSVYQLALKHQFNTGRRTEPRSIQSNTEVVIVDSMGELLGFYDLSDYAFVGGSLVPIGGHNVLEPIALGVPVLCGPHMQNTKTLCEELVGLGAIYQVSHVKQVVDAVRTLHQSPAKREQQIKQAATALRANQGAVDRHIEAMAPYWL